MGGLILAWAIGEGIIVWRSTVKEHHPPYPGQMLTATAIFALLAVLAEYEPARTAATAMAFGLDIAVLMQVLPGSGATTTAKKTTKAKTPAKGVAV
jgi:hypothetical protein